MEKKLSLPVCNEDRCVNWIMQEITVGPKYGKGIICCPICVLCKHRTQYDLYTRLEVGK